MASDEVELTLLSGGEPAAPPPEVLAQVEREKHMDVSVADALRNPHPLVVECQRALRKGAKTPHGLLCRGKERALEVEVSTASLPRAMRILDAFVKACEQRGIRLEVVERPNEAHAYTGEPYYGTELTYGAVEFGFRLREKLKPVRTESFGWMQTDLLFTGALELVLSTYDGSVAVRDAPTRPLEGALSEVFTRLPRAAHRIEAKREERRLKGEAFEKAFQEAARLREEQERLVREEQERERQLHAGLERWRLAREIRAYLADAQAAGRSEQLRPSLEWTLAYVERLEDLTRSPPGG